VEILMMIIGRTYRKAEKTDTRHCFGGARATPAAETTHGERYLRRHEAAAYLGGTPFAI
jgi:hypothetical protein